MILKRIKKKKHKPLTTKRKRKGKEWGLSKPEKSNKVTEKKNQKWVAAPFDCLINLVLA